MKRDRLIGYITLAVMFLTICVFAFSMWQSEKNAHHAVFVQFSEMGALQNEDIVTIRGFTIGKVASITKGENSKALVKIALDEPRIFRADTRFSNISPNIMGSRSIRIEPGKEGEAVTEDYIFQGDFEYGFAEVLQLANMAKQQVALIMELVRGLYSGDEKNPSLQKKFENILKECENLISSVGGVIEVTESEALSAVNKVGAYSAQVAAASDQINGVLDTLRIQAASGIESIDNVVEDVQTSIENLNKILTEFENNPVAIALLDERGIIDDIDSLVSGLQTFINSIDRQGIKLYDENGKRKSMVSLGNIHLIRETARSKAKKRAEEN